MNLTDNEEETPLFIAAGIDFHKGAKALLKFNANAAVQNRSGNTCLHVAVESKDYETVNTITEYCTPETVDMENNGKKTYNVDVQWRP